MRRADGLTPRQYEVMRHLALGKTCAAVGHDLGIAIQTVKAHRQRVAEALDVSCTIDCFRALGWLKVPE